MAIAPHQPQSHDPRAELVLHQLEALPTLPAVAVRVLEMTGEARTNARDLTTLIESDPALTARILRIVHRSDGGLRSDVNSIERAVVFLGFEAVRNAVLAVGVFEAFGPASTQDRSHPKSTGGKRFDRTAFWKHCVAVACMAELLAEVGSGQWSMGSQSTSSLPTAHCPPPTPSDAFVAGLLHDLGKVAIDAALPKSFARVIDAVELTRGDIADVERAVIGLDHMTIGKRLAERWMLPAMLRDCIWLHGQSPAALPAVCRHPRLVNLITLADIVARQQHLGFSGNHAFNVPIADLLNALGLTQAQLDAAVAQLVNRLEPRARSLGLGEATSEDLYRDALTQANRELGRMTDQLAAKNRKLAVRAKFFETLSAFHGELRPDAPPATVLFAIAQTAAQSLDTPAVAAYSLNASGGAEVIVVSKDGDVLTRDVVADLHTISAHVEVAQAEQIKAGIVHRADASLEALTDRVGPQLGGATVYTIPLTSEGLAIGGVLWGASADEQIRLASQSNELSALAGGWGLALRTCQIRDESKALSEQLADANRRLTGAQEEVMRARTLASIGEMAAGAAHEMNNPLAVIAGRSQLLALQLADGKHAGSARLVAEQAQRLSDIITELMDFARPTPPAPRACQIGELLNQGILLAQATGELADTRIELLTPIGSDVPPVRADAQQVAAAIREVLVNAAQSMDRVDDAKRVVGISAAFDRYGDQVVLSVSDVGSGMDEHVLSRAFDPFYSAKPAGRRRGMGLAKALRWVEGSGGRMRLESKPDEGTRVMIALRVATALDDARSAQVDPSQPQQKIA